METVILPKGRFVEGSLPMYADLSLLTAERHGVAGLVDEATYDFAGASPTMPLTVDEFEQAALDYPIVFVGPMRRAFAVAGLEAQRNPFVDTNGSFRANAYIPAYLRRHPFALVNDPNNSKWVLAVDEYSTRLAPRDQPRARPLFEHGAPAAAIREALAFCEAYQNAQSRTEVFVELLDELELFEARQAHHQLPDPDGTPGQPVLLLDYVAVCRSRLEALDSNAIARLRRIGALGPIYAHLLSESNWPRLASAAA